MLQFIRYIVRPSSTQLCFHDRKLHLKYTDIFSNVNLWIALEPQEVRYQQTHLLNTALFIHTDELIPNPLCITLRQYQIRNKLTQSTHHQRRRPFQHQRNFLIILRRIFSFRYLGTFRRSVNERRHIIQFKLRVYSPNLFNIYFSCCICRLGTDTFPFGQVIKWIQPSGSNECLNTWGNKLCSSSEDRKEFIVLILWRCWRI
jgi:hypothetical protein